MAEAFGVEDRGHFYDPVGALRDVVVNHLMQVVAAAAMEAPSRGDADTIKDAQSPRSSARSSLPTRRTTCAASTTATATIDGVAADSTTETYAALRLEIENWRWSGVPFFIRTGKRLPVTQTELRLVFKHPPRLGFGPADAGREPNQLVVKLDPSTGVRLIVEAHRADAPGRRPITLDMEFSEEGGEGPTPYEVLLHAAIVGDSTRFTRQDGVEEAWRVMQPLLDAPPPVHAVRARDRGGPTEAETLVAGHGRWHEPWIELAHPRRSADDRRPREHARHAPQSAAAPSPFPPIADYAFLSDCHTGALVAPDGAIDWLCVPRFDAPSVFGSLLDRQAGFFRFGPFGINHPTARAYVPGTNVLETTWKTPTGWVVVRDALTIGPRGPRGHGHAAHAAAGRRRRRPHARADGRVPRGPASRSSSSASPPSTTAATPATWTLGRRRRSRRRRVRRRA